MESLLGTDTVSGSAYILPAPVPGREEVVSTVERMHCEEEERGRKKRKAQVWHESFRTQTPRLGCKDSNPTFSCMALSLTPLLIISEGRSVVGLGAGIHVKPLGQPLEGPSLGASLSLLHSRGAEPREA